MNVGDKTLEQRLSEFILALGADIKALSNKDAAQDTIMGALNDLSTTQKGSLVEAINNVLAIATTAASVIDDGEGIEAEKTYSKLAISTKLQELKAQILGDMPPETLDTIKEIADWITNDESVMAGIVNSIAKRVAVDSAQTFTDEEKAQGRQNIGAQEAAAIGDTNTDLVALYTTAKA